jgi:hypothetical protein
MASMLALMGAVPITADEAAKDAGDKTLPPPKADPNYKEKPVDPPVKFGIIGLGPQGPDSITFTYDTHTASLVVRPRPTGEGSIHLQNRSQRNWRTSEDPPNSTPQPSGQRLNKTSPKF